MKDKLYKNKAAAAEDVGISSCEKGYESRSEEVRDLEVEMLLHSESSKNQYLKTFLHGNMLFLRNIILSCIKNKVDKEAPYNKGNSYHDLIKEFDNQEKIYKLQKERALRIKANHTVKSFKQAFEMLKKDLDEAKGEDEHREVISKVRRLKEQFDVLKKELKAKNLLTEAVNINDKPEHESVHQVNAVQQECLTPRRGI